MTEFHFVKIIACAFKVSSFFWHKMLSNSHEKQCTTLTDYSSKKFLSNPLEKQPEFLEKISPAVPRPHLLFNSPICQINMTSLSSTCWRTCQSNDVSFVYRCALSINGHLSNQSMWRHYGARRKLRTGLLSVRSLQLSCHISIFNPVLSSWTTLEDISAFFVFMCDHTWVLSPMPNLSDSVKTVCSCPCRTAPHFLAKNNALSLNSYGLWCITSNHL